MTTTLRNGNNHSIPLHHLPLRPSTLEVLQAAGFGTVAEVVESKERGSITNLAAELGVPPAQALGLYQEVTTEWANANGGDGDSNTENTNMRASAVELLQPSSSNNQTAGSGSIITFCRALDTILQGGLALGELTELAGPPGAGKTALAMQLAVDAALPVAYGGVHGGTVYVDTEGSFSAERCHALATALLRHIQGAWQKRSNTATTPPWHATPEDLLAGIHVVRVHDAAALAAVLAGTLPRLLQEFSTKKKPIRLVVIDSLAFPYRAAPPDADFVARTRQLTAQAAALAQLAARHACAVLAVNQMTTKMKNNHSDNSNGSSQLVPALGESWAHAVTTRLQLSCGSSDDGLRRVCRLTKSPRLPPATADFCIVEAGVRGVEYHHGNHASKKRARGGGAIEENEPAATSPA